MTQLTSHFSLDELTHSETAVRNGIDNVPHDPDVLANLQLLADGAERVRSVLGCAVLPSSGYRCEALEKVVCRKDFVAWCGRHGHEVGDASWAIYFKRKAHPKGLALDFIAPRFGTPAQIVAALAAEADYVDFEQLIVEGTWVHVAFAEEGRKPRREVLRATFKGGTPTYTKEK